jgi:hypothetical protein
MVADIEIRRLTGCAPTSTDISCLNTRLNAADTHSATCTANPIIISCVTVYSYWAVTQLHAVVAPDNLVDNIRWFTDGTNSYGCAAIDLQVGTATGYTQATGACGSGTLLNNTNYTTGTLTPACPTTDNAFSQTCASPLTVTGSTSGTGAFGDRVVMQLSVTSAGTPGTKPATPETITWRYDET